MALGRSDRTFTWQMSGMRELRDIILEAGPSASLLAATALYQEGLKMMAVSQRQVPVRWGILRSTGHVYPPTQRGRAVEVVLAYGGPAAPYAWVQHENLDLRHDEPTKAKYLEDPVMDRRDAFADAVNKRMRFIFESAREQGVEISRISWPTDHWQGPPPMRQARQRRSPRRPGQ